MTVDDFRAGMRPEPGPAGQKLGQCRNPGCGCDAREAGAKERVARERAVQVGWQGPDGFVPYPGQATCGETFAEWLQRIEDLARSGRHITPLPSYYQPAQLTARSFTRAEVLAVLKTRKAMLNVTERADASRYNELADLQQIFERME